MLKHLIQINYANLFYSDEGNLRDLAVTCTPFHKPMTSQFHIYIPIDAHLGQFGRLSSVIYELGLNFEVTHVF